MSWFAFSERSALLAESASKFLSFIYYLSGWLTKTTWQGTWGRRGCFLVRSEYAGLALPPGQGCTVTYSLNSHSHRGGIRCRDAWNVKSGLPQRGREREQEEELCPSFFTPFDSTRAKGIACFSAAASHGRPGHALNFKSEFAELRRVWMSSGPSRPHIHLRLASPAQGVFAVQLQARLKSMEWQTGRAARTPFSLKHLIICLGWSVPGYLIRLYYGEIRTGTAWVLNTVVTIYRDAKPLSSVITKDNFSGQILWYTESHNSKLQAYMW